MDKSDKTQASTTPLPSAYAERDTKQRPTSQADAGPGTKLKHTGSKPHVLHDGTLLVPGEVTEVPADVVTQLKAHQFGKTGKSSWDVLMEGDFEETDEDTTQRPKGKDKGGAVAPRYTSHLEQEEMRMPEAPIGRGSNPTGVPKEPPKDDGKGSRGSTKQ